MQYKVSIRWFGVMLAVAGSALGVLAEEKTRISYVPTSHLDLFWLGMPKTTLARGREILAQYLTRCVNMSNETFLVDAAVFAEDFLVCHPEWKEPMVRLMKEGRLEIGAAWVDRWETLVSGESLIRNVVAGQTWMRTGLGQTSRLASHPDLPSLTPQVAQIYRQAGIDYYATSRKIFKEGQVWRYRSPDGTPLLICMWAAGHYAFHPLAKEDLPENSPMRNWSEPINLTAVRKGFPRGTVVVSGGAADLACRKTFKERYGKYLEEFVSDYSMRRTDLSFGYTTVTRALDAYGPGDTLPERGLPIPSVWGVACDEEARWFQRDRTLEAELLGAETLAAVAEKLGINWVPASAGGWQGTFHEDAFFGRKDPVPAGNILAELWRMRVLTQDHNGGGCEGAQSSFVKRRLQERALAYSGQIQQTVLTGIGQRLKMPGPVLLLFNPLGQANGEPACVSLPPGWLKGHALTDEQGRPVLAQTLTRADGHVETWVKPSPVPSVGWLAVGRQPAAGETPKARIEIGHASDRLSLTSERMKVEIDLKKGRLTQIQDRTTGTDWGSPEVGRIWAIAEQGNDVGLKIATNAATAEECVTGFEVREQGPLFTRVTLKKRLLRSEIEQDVILWADGARVDLETRVWWTGARQWQIRQELPRAESRKALAYGQAFWGSGWEEIAEGAGPWLPDELSREDFESYRETLGWLHLRRGQTGLALLSTHPGFHADASGLRAVLFRTSSSCGDPNLFWENAGEHTFRFSLRPCGAEWKAAHVPQMAQVWERPVMGRLVQAGKGDLPATHSLLGINGEGVLLSALYPAQQKGAALVRVWESAGEKRDVTISGALATAAVTAEQVNLLEDKEAVLPKRADGWMCEIPGWGLRTLRLGR